MSMLDALFHLDNALDLDKKSQAESASHTTRRRLARVVPVLHWKPQMIGENANKAIRATLESQSFERRPMQSAHRSGTH